MSNSLQASLRLLAILWLPLLLTGASALTGCSTRSYPNRCCQICGVGEKPCGDQYVDVTETCLRPAGCACNK